MSHSFAQPGYRIAPVCPVPTSQAQAAHHIGVIAVVAVLGQRGGVVNTGWGSGDGLYARVRACPGAVQQSVRDSSRSRQLWRWAFKDPRVDTMQAVLRNI